MNAQRNTVLNDSTFNNLNSVVFNKDSIAKYTFDDYVFPLRSYLYPNNTGLSDEELYERYKAYHKAKKNGMKIEKPEITEDVLLVAEFRKILGDNPYKYISSGKKFYEYEVTNILIDNYNFYRIGDKIKVFELNEFINKAGYETLNLLYGDKLLLFMDDKNVYEDDSFNYGGVDYWRDKLFVMRDLYSTDSYFEYTNTFSKQMFNTDLKGLMKKCKEINAKMNDKSKPYFWYDYKLDEKQEKGE